MGECEGIARTRCPRRCDGSSPVRPRGDRSLLASMGAPLDLHGRIGPHDCLYEKGPGTSRTWEGGGSEGREATSARVHHAVDVDRLHGPSCRPSVRPPLWLVHHTARRCCGGRRPPCDRVLSHLLVYRENTFTSATIKS